MDDKVSALVAMLEGRVGFAGLAQVRAEAYNARIVGLLGSIERQVAALADPARGTRAEAEFLVRYRRQAHQQHGFLTPPDFDRRRRVPVADIYVPTAISEEDSPERLRLPPDTEAGSLKVWDLEGRLGRTVLLGDPGGGKTTAAQVLTDRFAADDSPRVAFLVTLREYAAKTSIDWSVAEHIEHNLSTLYQSPAPEGLVERLLLTGRAVVIFDGLDELLDTSRRRDVSDRVEQFCSAYPLAPVLVTSRVVGYDQARLDDTQFSCFRLGGFGDDEVAEYASKWFRSQEGLRAAEAAAKAESFLAESAHATDLRANPLLLSLMCILYRGAGSLPGDRAGIYARCAELLLRKWDEQRDLYRKLGSDHLVEPTLRYLAWWLFTRKDSQTAATERELIAKAAEFLHERGYETEEHARAAARDFVEFCRGRMWVFSDAGTTADGEQVYGFTHRTFLEYFAAWHLAVTSESPEDLARTLASRIAAEEWTMVAELAIKIKSDASDRGVDRIYASLLDPAFGEFRQEHVLKFLAELLRTVRPAPAVVRSLTRAALSYALNWAPHVYRALSPLDTLIEYAGAYQDLVGEELSLRIASVVTSGDAHGRAGCLRLVLSMPWPGAEHNEFWKSWAQEQAHCYAAEIASAAVHDRDLRILALYGDILTPQDALSMPGGLSTLATVGPITFDIPNHTSYWVPWFVSGVRAFFEMIELSDRHLSGFYSIGEHVLSLGILPRIQVTRSQRDKGYVFTRFSEEAESPELDQTGYLGLIIVICTTFELQSNMREAMEPLYRSPPKNAQTRLITSYLRRRSTGKKGEYLNLPVPPGFQQFFKDWSEGRVNVTEILDE